MSGRKRTPKATKRARRTPHPRRVKAKPASGGTRTASPRRTEATAGASPRLRPAMAPRPIDAALKAAALAVEPPINADRAALDQLFVGKLDAALARLSGQGMPFRLVEGFRTTERQQWLFGSGRPGVVPHGRPGPIVTNADGVTKLSRHQGTGIAGSGKAADCSIQSRTARYSFPPTRIRSGPRMRPPSWHKVW
jgi:hypothetical protein